MMALDGKAIIKEEITDKDAFEGTASSTTSNRRHKGGNTSNSSGKDTNSSGIVTNTSSNSNINSSSGGGSNTSSSIISISISSSSNNNNSNSIRSCRTPDSPDSVRAIAPRSPMSPQIHHSSLAPPPRPTRNSSSSPVVNGATTTPPPSVVVVAPSQAAVAAAAAAHVEQARLLAKVRKFLGSLVQLAQDVHPEVSERVRALVLSLGSGGISIDEFRIALHDAINLPLRPYVIPLLKNHISLLQREIAALSRATNQTTLQYVTLNENAVMEFVSHGPPAEYGDIFVQMDTTSGGVAANGGATSLVFKRRPSDSMSIEHHNGAQDWNDYMANQYPPAKRLHAAGHNPQSLIAGGPPEVRNANCSDSRVSSVFAGQPSLFEYPGNGPISQSEGSAGFGTILEKSQSGHRDERDMRAAVAVAAAAESQRMSRMGGEEEWKNIHTMLNCISAMVDKTKRAITILQQRGVDPQQQNFTPDPSSAAVHEIRRQTEEKVAEFKRNAEEAVNQVKRQAVIEIQRAVVSAENRAAEVMAQERLRMEKFFVEMSRHAGVEREIDNKSPSIASGQNACWNCGRKATETCSGCNFARYCGAFCQHKDWEHHHQICGNSRTPDIAGKHNSQAIPLTTASLRGNISRTPPTPSSAQQQPQPSQSQSQTANNSQSNSLVPNGIGSK